MDTKALVVGQEVYMESGVYSCRGKVIEVTSDGVTVDVFIPRHLTLARRELLRFDSEGKGKNAKGDDNNATIEGGPWYIVGT